MRLIEVVLVFLITLLATRDGSATDSSNKLQATTANAVTESHRKLLSFGNANQAKRGLQESTGISSTNEERLSSSTLASVEGRRAGTRTTSATTTSTTTTNGDGTITVSKYYNNGLKQKIEKWWKGLFNSSPTRRLRQVWRNWCTCTV